MLRYQTRPGDLDQIIADDHAVVERQFQRLEAGGAVNRRIMVDQIIYELALHTAAEERVLYPTMRRAGLDEAADDAVAEHQRAKEQLAVLEDTELGETRFDQTLGELIAGLRDHMRDEETDDLPRLRDLLGQDRMAELGREFLEAKRHAPGRPHPNAPSGGTAHTILDPVVALVDAWRDSTSGRIETLATDASGQLDPQAQRVLDAFASFAPDPPEILEPKRARSQKTHADAVRKVLADDGRSTDPEPVALVEERQINSPGGSLTVRIYVPDGPSAVARPVLMWIHGGGWVLFDLDTYDASCRGMANKTGAIVVSPDYRKAPEHPFPAAHDDVLAAFRWVRANAASFGGDPEQVAIGGESVGGTMAAATSLTLISSGEQRPSSQVLVYPLTTAEGFGDSMRDEADARPLNLPLLSWMAMHAFHGRPQAVRDPRVALLDLGSEQLSQMPPTLVITAERDPLRDQGEAFARNLEAAGVPVTVTRYDGVMHEFFGAAAVLDQAEQAQRRAAGHVIANLTAA